VALISVGLDHEHASLELRERATVPEHAWPKVLRTLVSHRNINAAVFVSTCLRTEIVADIDRFHGAIDEITTTLSEATGVASAEIEQHLTIHFDRGVANHLFAVAAGLKSVVPGEFEVLGQLRRALELASDEHTTNPTLADLFTRALSSGRRVRAETNIARGTTSFAHASVEVALASLDGAPMRAVVLGAGQLASGVARSLLGTAPVSTLTILNRTSSRAEELAGVLGDDRVRVGTLADVATHLAEADVVFVAIDTPEPTITRSMLEGRATPLLAVDLAMPHGVARDVELVEGVRRLDIDTLKQRVDRALDDRREAVADAETIVRHDVEKFLDDQRARGAALIVSELREHFDAVVDGELLRRASEIDQWSDVEREALKSILRSVVAKIAHRPTSALKESAGTDQGARLAEATRTLFDLGS